MNFKRKISSLKVELFTAQVLCEFWGQTEKVNMHSLNS